MSLFLRISSFCIITVLSCSRLTPELFQVDLIPVYSAEKWGYVNTTGKYIVNPQFAFADFYSEGIALVRTAEGKYGYIDKAGKFLVTPRFLRASSYSEGIACVVEENGPIQYIDKEGSKLFELRDAEQADNFHEGLARFQSSNGKWGFVDRTGNISINPQFDLVYSFKNGRALICSKPVDDETARWGAIDKQGTLIINPQFSRMRFFNEGLSQVSLDSKMFGFVDNQGKIVINPQFEYAGSFFNGLATIRQGKLYGFIDTKGRISINPQFDQVLENSSSDMIAVKSGSRWGFVDKQGKYLINPQFDYVSPFLGNISLVTLGEKVGIIDKNGKYLANPQFDSVPYESLLRYSTMGSGYISGAIETDFFDINSFYSTVNTLLNLAANHTTVRAALTALAVNESDLSQQSININSYYRDSTAFDSKNVKFSSIFSEFDTATFENQPIYETYTDYYGNESQRIKNYKKIFNESAAIRTIVLKIQLRERAEGKGSSIASSIYDLYIQEHQPTIDNEKSLSLEKRIRYRNSLQVDFVKCPVVSGSQVLIIVGQADNIQIAFYKGNADFIKTTLGAYY